MFVNVSGLDAKLLFFNNELTILPQFVSTFFIFTQYGIQTWMVPAGWTIVFAPIIIRKNEDSGVEKLIFSKRVNALTFFFFTLLLISGVYTFLFFISKFTLLTWKIFHYKIQLLLVDGNAKGRNFCLKRCLSMCKVLPSFSLLLQFPQWRYFNVSRHDNLMLIMNFHINVVMYKIL